MSDLFRKITRKKAKLISPTDPKPHSLNERSQNTVKVKIGFILMAYFQVFAL